jgi:anti-sigma factor RsiW
VHGSDPTHNGESAGLGATADEVTCRELVELVTDYLEGALPPRTLSHVEEHLVICDPCAAYVEQMRTTIAWLGELREGPSAEPRGPLLAALRARSEADG